MCWVMPPASPATTLALRMASSSDVLPWSTWPMMVTTGGRGSRSSSSSGVSKRPSSTSDSATRLTVWPNSVSDQLGGIGVDHVVDLVHLALRHQQLDHVDGALGHAVGEFLDGDRLGQHDFAHDLLLRLADAAGLQLLRCARRKEATERVRSSSSKCGVDGQAAAILRRRSRGGLDRQRRLGRLKRTAAHSCVRRSSARARARRAAPVAAAPPAAGGGGGAPLRRLCCASLGLAPGGAPLRRACGPAPRARPFAGFVFGRAPASYPGLRHPPPRATGILERAARASLLVRLRQRSFSPLRARDGAASSSCGREASALLQERRGCGRTSRLALRPSQHLAVRGFSPGVGACASSSSRPPPPWSGRAEALADHALLRPSASAQASCVRMPRSVLSPVSFVSVIHASCVEVSRSTGSGKPRRVLARGPLGSAAATAACRGSVRRRRLETLQHVPHLAARWPNSIRRSSIRRGSISGGHRRTY